VFLQERNGGAAIAQLRLADPHANLRIKKVEATTRAVSA
jgi:hypothetical protein